MVPMRKSIPIIAGSTESESRYVNAVGRRSADATRCGPAVRDAQGWLEEISLHESNAENWILKKLLDFVLPAYTHTPGRKRTKPLLPTFKIYILPTIFCMTRP